MEMTLNIAIYHAPQRPNQFVHLPGVGASYGIRNPNPCDAKLIDSLVNAQKIDEIAPERVLGGESDLEALALDEGDDLNGLGGNVVHVLAVRELAEVGGGADDNVKTVNTRFDRNPGVVHVAPDVRQDLGFEP
ncbi:hypothetical protein BC936DRAFT_146885 [Jimgerdemannia flammicorona]|uniref:Uncharacterized protein n=2 Tax=Jimgerdemannia flammicorona TaxID=994334 RepID=A0A433D6Q4_9FUNG|nr:hypothetical protein BC936DRAFT_146885 [Jimgerdemannia flammicorona]RUS27703.1 hypothetical protein BC938DRAFT_482860 [Jimgerdemannia flammicorona]